MSTPQQLIQKYNKEICSTCSQEGECNIHIVRSNKTVTAKCTDYKRLEHCMQHKCNTCKDNLECFGSGNNEQ